MDDAPKKKGKLMLFLVPALIVGLLSGTALGVAQNDTMARVYAMMEADAEDEAEGDAEGDAEDGAEAEAPEVTEEEDPDAFGAFAEMTGLIVNPAGTDGNRYLMISVAFEGSEDAVAELDTREVIVKDRLLRHLAEQPVSRLAAFANRDTLKHELLERANGALQEGKLSRLYFTQYVLQ